MVMVICRVEVISVIFHIFIFILISDYQGEVLRYRRCNHRIQRVYFVYRPGCIGLFSILLFDMVDVDVRRYGMS